jgi:hypothetical protein
MESLLFNELEALGPGFRQEVRKRLAPVKDRFFQAPPNAHEEFLKDGLLTPPYFLTDPELWKVAIELAELALENGIDVNVAWDADGSTILHGFALSRDPSVVIVAVTWLLAHGADPNQVRNDGESPLSLAMKLGRTEIVELMRRNSN